MSRCQSFFHPIYVKKKPFVHFLISNLFLREKLLTRRKQHIRDENTRIHYLLKRRNEIELKDKKTPREKSLPIE